MVGRSWPVTQEQVKARPTKENTCFYCHVAVGGQHGGECPLRTRRVRVRVALEFDYDVPECWDDDMAGFHLTESSFCFDNVIQELLERSDKSCGPDIGCSCIMVKDLEIL